MLGGPNMWEMRLVSLNSVPPGLFRFRHPISGTEQAFHTWSLLREWVTDHCDANRYPSISDQEIQQQMCERFGPDKVKMYCEGDGVTVEGVNLGWRDILQGTKVLGAFVLAGRPLVSQVEADRRAAICSGCSRNVGFGKPCGGLCGELQEAVEAIVGHQTTVYDDKLEACAVCKCSLKSKVWVPMEFVNIGITDEIKQQLPSFCWQLPENS